MLCNFQLYVQQNDSVIRIHMCAACLVTQSCLTPWDSIDCSSPGSSAHRLSQARILEWGAISYSRGSSRPRDQTAVSCVSCIGMQILYH